MMGRSGAVQARRYDQRPMPDEPSADLNRGRRREDGWLERWMVTTEDLARLQYSHRMVDAVIDEINGREIRIGKQWLIDFASCNYLGFDLDAEIIAAARQPDPV
jgi:hypothetical protein